MFQFSTARRGKEKLRLKEKY